MAGIYINIEKEVREMLLQQHNNMTRLDKDWAWYELEPFKGFNATRWLLTRRPNIKYV